ncbi:glycosyltransferase family 2 protein [Flavobacterium sp. KACC 22763]|uniref:glycosyltransferase family 2 protein n=1 Tax=Flavobacterium sp. KACC 22763 TaxID=3025668 RepID=UPI0023650D87|nr:glycosyltransferase [Flavobacterium sp. KACC 22763]WDF62872.1 glycosyltransferase [Flavobacterium sp. KACC 22763]
MSNPLVSVVIPTYNRNIYLEEAIRSVSLQTYNNIEILVIDDGSKINYAESICSNYSNCFYFYKNNGGLSSARNYGISLAKGEFIAFLDDDDFWGNSKIEKQIKILLENPSIDCVHSSAEVVDENGKHTGKYYGASPNKVQKRSGYVFWNALCAWVIKSPTPLIRKKVFQQDLMFDETIKAGEDIDFYQRMFFRHKVGYINEALAFYREYNNDGRLSLQQEKYRGIEKKMLTNFKDMGIKNPIILYFIAMRLLKSAIRRHNNLSPKQIVINNKFDFYFRPSYCLKKMF